MINWYPLANKLTLGNSSGSFLSEYPFRGVLHTTEGNSVSGAVSAYKKNNSWPHFTVDKNGTVYQHLSLNIAARALENRSGGIQTNRGGAIQIEVVGFASNPIWPQPQVESMRALMRWIEGETGIKQVGPQFGGNPQYGLGNPLEFTNDQWKNFNGWCGHQHVPENLHWDPGAIILATLFEPPAPPPPVPPPPNQEYELDVNVQNVEYQFTTDDKGNGWVKIPYHVDNIISILQPGLRPGADLKYLSGDVAVAPEGNETILSIQEWAPSTQVVIRLRVRV